MNSLQRLLEDTEYFCLKLTHSLMPGEWISARGRAGLTSG